VIVDSHLYCFTAPDTLAGHRSVAEHMALWQWGYALMHQPAWYTDDRSPADSTVLLDPTPQDPLHRATNRDFRADHVHNRLIWTVDGRDATKQFLPPNTLAFTPGAAIAEMDYVGVDWGLIHVDAALTKDIAYLAECVRRYPDRLRSMAPVEEALIPTHPGTAVARAREAIERHGLHALKVIPEYAYRTGLTTDFTDARWTPFWDGVRDLPVPVFFTLAPARGSSNPRGGFIDELWRLVRLHERYPELRISITHGFYWRDWLTPDRHAFELDPAMWEPFNADRGLHLEVSFPVRIGDLFEYPYRETWPVLRAMVEHIGPSRLLWGTDMPFQNRFCTYRQSRAYIERHCTSFLSASDLAAIMGGTAARLLDLPRARLSPGQAAREAVV
jgi:predicted TIM-barrel fold metal-dependent hydrolase